MIRVTSSALGQRLDISHTVDSTVPSRVKRQETPVLIDPVAGVARRP